MEKEEIKYTGVCYEPQRKESKKWSAVVYHHGKKFWVGRYPTQAKAIEAHTKYKEKLIQEELKDVDKQLL